MPGRRSMIRRRRRKRRKEGEDGERVEMEKSPFHTDVFLHICMFATFHLSIQSNQRRIHRNVCHVWYTSALFIGLSTMTKGMFP